LRPLDFEMNSGETADEGAKRIVHLIRVMTGDELFEVDCKQIEQLRNNMPE